MSTESLARLARLVTAGLALGFGWRALANEGEAGAGPRDGK